MSRSETFFGIVKKFTGNMGWFYVLIPKAKIPKKLPKVKWGIIPIKATINQTSWDTSILPFGNGQNFIALKAVIRKKENIKLRDKIKISFQIK